jgi:hypothetical protein
MLPTCFWDVLPHAQAYDAAWGATGQQTTPMLEQPKS